MNRILLILAIVALLAFPKANFGQAPNLGSTSSFALFTASGAFNNNGASLITGNIGSFNSSPVGFPPGIVNGNIYTVGDPALNAPFADVSTAFSNFTTGGIPLATPLTGSIVPKTYSTVGAAALNGNFTLDAQGNPDAIFVININGALTVSSLSNILLINGASWCNVYWQINGAFSLGAGAHFEGTVISNGAITLLEGSSLLGRGLTTAGAIELHNNVVNLPLPAAAGTITGTETVCSGQQGVVFSVPVINNSTGYIWTLPAGATIVAGMNTNSIIVDFSAGAASGKITVSGTSACSNGAVSANFPITVNPSPAAPTVSLLQPTCALATGTITVTAQGAPVYMVTGTNPVVAAVSNGTGIFAGLSAGVYNVTVTSATGCISPATSVTILAQPLAPVAPTVSLIQPTCALATGTITVTAQGAPVYTVTGTNPVVAAVSNGTGIFAGLSAGVYNVTVTSAAGCISPATSVTILAQPLAPLAPTVSLLQPTCALATGTITVTAPGAPVYKVTGTNPVVAAVSNGTGIFAGLSAGVYNVTVTSAAGCISPATSVTILAQPLAPLAPTVSLLQPTCALATGTITVTAPGAPVYTVTGTNPVVAAVSNGTGIFAGLSAGVYNVTVTSAAGCIPPATSVTILAQPLAPVAPTVSLLQPTCALATGTITVTAPGAPVYTVTGTNPVVAAVSNGTGIFAGLSAGVYNVTVTSAAGCIPPATSVTILAQPLAPVAPTVSLLQPTCALATGTITVTAPGAPVYTVTGTNPVVAAVSNGTGIFAGLSAGVYNVTVTSATGCIPPATSVTILAQPLAPPAIAGADRTICLNNSTQIGGVVISGSTYSWSSVPAGFASTVSNPTATPLVTTTYTVVETNSSMTCATNRNSVVVTVLPSLSALAGADRTICLNECTQIGGVAVSGSTYSWSSVPEGFTSTESNPKVCPKVTTTYTVVETNSSMTCATNRNSVIVTVLPSPSALAGADRTICLNECTQIGGVAVSGSTYSWSSVPVRFTSTVSNLKVCPIPEVFTSTESNPKVCPKVTTTYTVVETNTASGCTNRNSVIVTVLPSPSALAGADRTICLNECTQIGGVAVSGSTYSWSSVAEKFTSTVSNLKVCPIPEVFTSTESNPKVCPKVTTTYTVVETNTASVCTNSNSVVVTVVPSPSALAGADRSICLNECTQIGGVAVSGSTYSWSSVPKGFTSTVSNLKVCPICPIPEGFTSTESNPKVCPKVTTTYTVVETNVASGCSNSKSVTVTLNVHPEITTEPADQITRIGSSVSFSVAAKGTGLSYQWRKGTLALTNGENILGTTSATLIILSVSAADVSSCYNVLVTGPCEAMDSSKNASLSLSNPSGNASLNSEVTNIAVTIYPNPFTSSLDIKVNKGAEMNSYELKIYNNLGDLLFNTPLTKDITTLQTGNLSPGVYLYEVRSQNKIIQVGKLISNK